MEERAGDSVIFRKAWINTVSNPSINMSHKLYDLGQTTLLSRTQEKSCLPFKELSETPWPKAAAV